MNPPGKVNACTTTIKAVNRYPPASNNSAARTFRRVLGEQQHRGDEIRGRDDGLHGRNEAVAARQRNRPNQSDAGSRADDPYIERSRHLRCR